MIMKAIALFSGGKDSFMSAQIAMEQGFEIVKALTIDPEEFSFMFHFPNVDKADLAASLLGLEVEHIREDDFEKRIREFAESGIDALVSGAIASEYQKTRIERICTEYGLISFTPLWKKKQPDLLRELQSRGIRAIVVSVAAEGLDESDLGRIIDTDYMEHLSKLEEKYRINVAGEGGEYESFVCEIAGGRKVTIRKARKVWEGSHGYYLIEDAELS